MGNFNKVAIIGIGCKFPGSDNYHGFWEALKNGVESIAKFTITQLKNSGVPENHYRHPAYVAYRGVLNNVEHFDTDLFNFPHDEIKYMDVRARNLLQVTKAALEDAGMGTCPKRTSVYIGANSIKPDSENALHMQKIDMNMAKMYSYSSSLASLLAYQFSLEGAAMTVNSACSTSLVSVIKACEDLILKNSDMAIAGGVSIDTPQEFGHVYEEGGIFSSDGHCRTFDAKASGAVFANGVGVVILKRLDDAIKDKDNIHAVILGHAVNNDAREKLGFLAPSIAGQYACIKQAWSMADVSNQSVDYIETHGAATITGDPIECYALKKFFQNDATRSDKFCGLGCVKSNIGHTRTAAGVAGLIKTALMVKHKAIVPTLHVKNVNSFLDIENSPFYITQKFSRYPKGKKQMTAGVSSFGFGGTNAHMVLQSMSKINNE